MATKTVAKPAPKAAPPKPQQKPSTAVAARKETLPSTDVDDLLEQHAGLGISHRQEDNIVPLIYLLQPLSPQAMRGNKEKYIQGAEAGDIWLRNSPEEVCIVKADDGLLFQPCYFTTCWIEWMPNRGGFVARHKDRPEVAELKDVERDDGSITKQWQMPNGNTVNESREFSGFAVIGDDMIADAVPYTIPLSGSGHTVGKAWMTSMRDRKLPSGKGEPLFANYWRLKTVMKSRNNYNWYIYDIKLEGKVSSAEEVARGLALHQAFAAGEKESAAYDETVDGAASGDGADGNI